MRLPFVSGALLALSLLLGCGELAVPPLDRLLDRVADLDIDLTPAAVDVSTDLVGEVFAVALAAGGRVQFGPFGRATDGDWTSARFQADDVVANRKTRNAIQQAAKAQAEAFEQTPASRPSPLPIILLADRRTPWAFLCWVMSSAAEAGCARIRFAVRDPEGGGARLLAYELPQGLSPPPERDRFCATLQVGLVTKHRLQEPELSRRLTLKLTFTEGYENRNVWPGRLPGRPPLGPLSLQMEGDGAAAVEVLHARAKEIADFTRAWWGGRDRAWIEIQLQLTPTASEEVRVTDVLPVLAALLAIGADSVGLHHAPDSFSEHVPESEQDDDFGTTWDDLRGPSGVSGASRWLAAHQSPSGAWEAAGFARTCDGEEQEVPTGLDGAGSPDRDVGATALATLLFLARGYAPGSKHRYQQVVARGLAWLAEQQDPAGRFHAGEGPDVDADDHALATLTYVVAARLTEDKKITARARRGLTALKALPSAPTLRMLPLLAAWAADREAEERVRPSPFHLDATAFRPIDRWVRERDAASHPTLPEGAAIDLFAGLFLPGAAKDEWRELAERLARVPRAMKGAEADPLRLWLGTLALQEVGGTPWKTWTTNVVPATSASQRGGLEPCVVEGSWDSFGALGQELGRVGTTALMALILVCRDRYMDRIFR